MTKDNTYESFEPINALDLPPTQVRIESPSIPSSESPPSDTLSIRQVYSRRKTVPEAIQIQKPQPQTSDPVAGIMVAARVSDDNAEKDEWFVVKVTNFDKDTKEFEVLDEEPGDDEESTQQRKYKLPASHIIPFPKKNDPSSAPEFQPGRHVLAVYPCTTALYKATVVNSHRKRKTDDYLLEFDDDEEDGSLPQRSVPFYKVVPLPDGHRQ
ncbi:hypothetical protein ZIOFF_052268 [Zingiber officinale]|uniref:SGF29 C-terminal domain-containing protein n=1 Tax=Zingiber officinale TaxID=94328 RepID=A0A8J5KNE0_ZINOF|nr:hypothetical protein ZIOFF_052268 [Zingiber officinale]